MEQLLTVTTAIYSLVGLAVGFVIGLTGIGGGSLMTPILISGFHVPAALAVGTDLLYASVTKTSGVFVHWRRDTINWKVARALLLGSVPAAIAVIAVLHYTEFDKKSVDLMMKKSLGVALVLTSIVLLFRARIQAFAVKREFDWTSSPSRLALRSRITVVAGALIGVLVTLSSVGAGAVGTTVVWLLYPEMPLIIIVGTELAVAVPLTLIAGLGHLQLGNVDLSLLVGLLVGSLPGVYMGAKAGNRVSERVLRPILATLLTILGVRMAMA